MKGFTCETCHYWQDYTERFQARLSFKYNANMGGGTFELRLCRNEPPPHVRADGRVYTDKDFGCSGWQPISKE